MGPWKGVLNILFQSLAGKGFTPPITVRLGSTDNLTLWGLFYPINRPKRAIWPSSGIKNGMMYTAACPIFDFVKIFGVKQPSQSVTIHLLLVRS